jgi:hypothetical protein
MGYLGKYNTCKSSSTCFWAFSHTLQRVPSNFIMFIHLSVCCDACLSTCVNLAVRMGGFCWNFILDSRKIQVWLKLNKDVGHLTWRHKYVYIAYSNTKLHPKANCVKVERHFQTVILSVTKLILGRYTDLI